MEIPDLSWKINQSINFQEKSEPRLSAEMNGEVLKASSIANKVSRNAQIVGSLSQQKQSQDGFFIKPNKMFHNIFDHKRFKVCPKGNSNLSKAKKTGLCKL